MRTFLSRQAMAAAAIALSALLGPVATAQVVSPQFQNGTDGYSGTFDRLISTDIGAEILGADTAS